MDNAAIPIIFKSALILAMTILFAFTPDISGKNVFFGISIPAEHLDNPKLTKTKRLYRTMLILWGAILTCVGVVLDINTAAMFADMFVTVSLILLLAVCLVLYSIANKSVKSLKQKNGWFIEVNQSPLEPIDTSFNEGKLCPSQWWFLVHLSLIMITAAMLYFAYPTMPEYLALNLNWAGEVTRSAPKSYATVFIPVVSQIFVTLLCFGIFRTIKRISMKISPIKPRASLFNNRKLRYIWSAYLIVITLLMDLMFAVIGQFLFITTDLRYLSSYFMFGTLFLVTVGTALMAVQTYRIYRK